MKALLIRSPHTNETLAEIRTDGKLVQFLFDKTNGKIQALFKDGLMAGINAIDESDNLEIVKNDGIKSYPYTLTNGDVISISTDGKTACLNGRMLTPEEFKRVHELLATGKLKVASKADLSYPNELLGIPREKPSVFDEHKRNESKELLQAYAKRNKTAIGSYTRDSDPHIADMRFDQLDENMREMMRNIVKDIVYGSKQ